MLRAVSSLCVEGRALEGLAVASAAATTRWDTAASFRRSIHGSTPLSLSAQTVLSTESGGEKKVQPAGAGGGGAGGEGAPPPPPPAPARTPPPPRLWPYAAVAALTASLGGAYMYRKYTLENDRERDARQEEAPPVAPPYPAAGSQFPPHVQYLIAGAGTAAFAAMRAIRSARPDAQVLMVGAERALPYMRPPLSKEVWREPDLATRALSPDSLTFRQWNGKRRPLVYEPAAFYTPVERLAAPQGAPGGGAPGGGGAAVARGWTVTKIDVVKHTAQLSAPGRPPVTIGYDKCLVATGVRPRRVPALSEAAARGLSLPLRGVGDAGRIADRLDRPHTSTVAVVGGGFLATELAAALADRLGCGSGGDGGDKRVVLVVPEAAPMAGVLPHYLAEDIARRLTEAGVTLIRNAEIVSADVVKAAGGGEESVSLRVSGGGEGGEVRAQLVVEGAGAEFDATLATASGLEVHPELGGVLVNAEMQARTDVYAAGDAACYYDVVLGRRRVEHHDHAVVSGRLAGNNMANSGSGSGAAPQHYTHQSMFWSDLGPQLGYEAIGIIDSRLPTVGIFSTDAVHTAARGAQLTPAAPAQGEGQGEGALERQYSRGVVLYLREQRVVGVLLWNLFNRMHLARQVLAQGEFEDLFEVGKLFAPHEDD